MKTPNKLLVLLAALTQAAAVLLTAQTTNPSNTTDDPKKDETITLTPFEVKADTGRGYVTTSSMSASRIAAPITEVPGALIVVNEKLIADTVAVDLKDTLSLVSGIQQSFQPQGSNQITLRGYTTAGALRDGLADNLISSNFNASGGFDYSLVDRLEIVKGPSGVLYGQHSPGGILNFISKRPLYKPLTKISITAGTDNYYRAELDTSNFFDQDQKFGYRLSAARADTDGQIKDRPEEGDGLIVLNPSLSYRTNNGWYFWVWSAIIRDHQKRNYLGTPAMGTDPNFSLPSNPSLNGAPLYEIRLNHMVRNMQNTDTDAYEAGVTKGFDLGPVRLDARVVGRTWHQGGENQSRLRAVDAFDQLIDSNDRIITVDWRSVPLSTVQGRIAKVGRLALRYDYNPYDQRGKIAAGDFNFDFKIGPVRNQLLAYAGKGYTQNKSTFSTYDIRNPATLSSLGFPTIDGKVIVVYYPTYPVVPTVNQVLTLSDVRSPGAQSVVKANTSNYGFLERLSFWDNRIFLVGGMRHDNFSSDVYSITLEGNGVRGPTTVQADSVTTSSVSALVKVLKGEKGEVSAYATSNETFIPEFRTDLRLATLGQKFPNRMAKNKEFGIKADMFKSRLVGTAAVFETTENDVLVPGNDEFGLITGRPASGYFNPVGTRVTKGWETDLNIVPFRDWEVILAYAKVNPKLASGRYAQRIAFNTFSAAIRHEFNTGPLKGLSAMWQYNKWGKSSLSDRAYWIVPGGDIHVLLLGYEVNKRWSLRLRVDNVFDNQKATYPADNETALDVPQRRNWRFSMTYAF